MSKKHSRGSRSMVWALSVLMVPALYLVTGPPIIVSAAKYFGSSQPIGNFMMSYSAPYFWLGARKPFQRPLSAYMQYWIRMLDYNPETITITPDENAIQISN
jgi:hypothetical protein